MGACRLDPPQPIQRFTLESHAGPYESWPQRSRLLDDGVPTGVSLPGFHIGFQFALGDGSFLVVTDWDCPHEEIYEVLLLSSTLALLERASDPRRAVVIASALVGAVGVSARNLYCTAQTLGPRTVRLLGCSRPPHLTIEVRERRLCRRRLVLTFDEG